jgi:hypothetical protein
MDPRMTALARASSNYKRLNRKCSVGKNAGRGSQGAWRQDELIGGKPPVVKGL